VADAPPAAPLLLASTSPQRRAILEQLGIPFDVIAPKYDERDVEAQNALRIVQEHAQGKARSVVDDADGRPVIGVDTAVVLGGEVFGKPGDAGEAERMLERLSGQRHAVISGLCLLTPGWEFADADTTLVAVRTLTPRDLAAYVASGDWENRAGAYAIQGRGAALVESIQGDYLNVVGLPASLLVRVLAERFAGVYGFG